ncbi:MULTISPECIES: DUF3429 domain-containing protein [Alphaproteobacteria]|uniref:DUF3429 domain-containing protein n=1 Tax=Alphaproteobacteria TaxID=28211 RepID=UPI003519048D
MTDLDRHGDAPTPHAALAATDITHKTAWILGLAGLIPFVAMTAALAYAGRAFIAYPQLVLALSGYSATILAFLGGIRWGAALWRDHGQRHILVLSVLASLVGWALLFVPTPWMFAGFAIAFALVGVWDVLAARRRTLPDWFGRLRLVLTIVVVLCQLVAFASTF